MSEVKVDTISERTAAGGVTIDGVLIKDSIVNTDNIAEKTAAAGVTIDGVLVKDGVATFQTAAGSPLVFEGATADAFETTFAITDPTADRTITFPDSSFTVPTSGGLFSGYAVFADQKTLGTNGGTFTSGDWRQRDINTTIVNTDTTNIALGTNEFTLLAGNYLIEWDVAVYAVYQNITRLYDGTSSVGQGLSSNSNTWGTPGSARVAPGTSTTYQIQHKCDITGTTNGFGLQAGYSTEQYLTVTIYKES